MAVYEEGFAPATDPSRVSHLINLFGAALSLALILGIGFWGYALIQRDVSGIPVVRALEGEMRVLPENPGGAIAPHTGLSVNEVAAQGAAGGPEDMLVLAPRGADLQIEDLVATPAAVAPSAATQSAADETLAALTAALADTPAPPQAEPSGRLPAVIPASVPGVSSSLRPMVRPVGFVTTTKSAASAAEVMLTTTAFPPGTHLVQLGAFASPGLAAAAWDRLQTRFAPLLGAHARVIELSNQSSATWYRLRASGFEDRAAAQRLCAALQAEGAECIAVVTN